MKLKICLSIVMLLSLKGINSAYVELQNPRTGDILQAKTPEEKVSFLKQKKEYFNTIQRKEGKFRDQTFIAIISKIEAIQQLLESGYSFFNLEQSVRLNELLLQFFSKVESIETNISIKGSFGRSSSYKRTIVDHMEELNQVYSSIEHLFEVAQQKQEAISLRKLREQELVDLNATGTIFEEQIQQYRLKEAAEAAAKAAAEARIGYQKPIEELSYEEYY